MKIIDCIQGSPSWWEAHRGIPSASNFGRIMTPDRKRSSAQSSTYICQLVAETLFNTPMEPERYASRAMLNGIQMEPEARDYYCLTRNVEVTQVGFCISDCGRFGASPDSLVGEDGALECKCPEAKTQVQYLLTQRTKPNAIPSEYLCQVHGELIVTGRKWVDFLSYVPGLQPILVRVEPNEFTKALKKELEAFHARYVIALRTIQGKLEPEPVVWPPPELSDLEALQREIDEALK